MTNREKLIDKIRKLKAMTTAAGCTEAEALAAAEKLGQLLTEHNITLAEVDAKAQRSGFDFGYGKDPKRRTLHPVVGWTSGAIAFYTDTATWRQGSTICFFGDMVDVEVALYLAALFRNVAESEYAVWTGSNAGGIVIKNSFMLGFATRVSARLRAMKDAQSRQVHEATGRDLVVVKTELVKQEFEARGPKLGKPSKSRISTSGAAIAAGAKAGDRCQINPGVTGNGSRPTLLR